MRKLLFWAHLSGGVTAGLFIFIMAATGVLLSFEKQIVDFVDRDLRSVTIPNDAKLRPVNELVQSVRRSGLGEPSAIVLRDEPQAAIQFSIGRGKTLYVDPYSGAVLGGSSQTAHQFFSSIERVHRTLGAPLGSKGVGHWLTAVSNLLFGALILLGVILWIPRRWNWKALRAILTLRLRLRGKAREWIWHNAIGIWCAMPLLLMALTGVVMSFEWANALLFRLAGSPVPVSRQVAGNRGQREFHRSGQGVDPNYDRLLGTAMTLNRGWHTITLNMAQSANSPISGSVDTGTGGQPQKRSSYLLDRETGTVMKRVDFSDGSLGQRLRAFVRFGHTGEWGGLLGQTVAALASLGACVLVYTGISLSVRRLLAKLKAGRRDVLLGTELRLEQPVGYLSSAVGELGKDRKMG